MSIGATGSGKSSLWHSLMPILIEQGLGMLAIELYKAEYRHLYSACQRLGRPLHVLEAKHLRWNPCQPEGDPKKHMQSLCSSLSRSLGLPDRTEMLLRKVIYELYCQRGLFDGRPDASPPTLFDVYERARTTDANHAARETLLDRLASLLIELGPEVLAYRKGWQSADLLDRLVVLELGGSSEAAKEFISSSLLFGMFNSRLQQGAINAPLTHVTLLDDAQRQLSGISREGMLPIEELLGLVRGAGLMIGMNVQSCASLSPGIMANVSVKVIGRLGSSSDVRRIKHELDLDESQTRFMRDELKPGTYIAQLSSGPMRKPFVLKLAKPTLDPVTEPMLEAGRRALDVLPVIPAPEFSQWTPWGQRSAPVTLKSDKQSVTASLTKCDANVIGQESGISTSGINPDPIAQFSLTEHQRRLLIAVVDHPLEPLTSYPKLACIKPSDAKKARIALVELGLIRIRTVSIKGRGRPPKIIEPTQSTLAIVDRFR
jgi:hypothetical protein